MLSKKGQVIISQTGKTNTFSVIYKDNYYDHTSREDILCNTRALKEAVNNIRATSFRITSLPDNSK